MFLSFSGFELGFFIATSRSSRAHTYPKMSDSKGDSKQQHQQHLSTPTPPDDPDQIQDPTQQTISTNIPQQPPSQQQQPVGVVVPGASQFISGPLYNIPSVGTTGTTFEQQQQQFEAVSTKRPRYAATQWKLSPSTSQQQKTQTQTNILMIAESSSPSPTPQATTNQPQALPHTVPASSSDTASSPSHSPRPSHSAASTQETTNPESHQFHQQFRKGKYVSPVWKPNEMLWLARAWRVQYQGGGSVGSEGEVVGHPSAADVAMAPARGKTRAEKDKEVAEYLNRHGVNRDAKTAGTKWDNMLGEFRKVYEWERGGERDQVGKSYFRLSPYERKLHRLPASFDEEVFEELSQFMGSRMRTPQSRGVSPVVSAAGEVVRPIVQPTKSLPPPPPYREEDLPLSGMYIVLLDSI